MLRGRTDADEINLREIKTRYRDEWRRRKSKELLRRRKKCIIRDSDSIYFPIASISLSSQPSSRWSESCSTSKCSSLPLCSHYQSTCNSWSFTSADTAAFFSLISFLMKFLSYQFELDSICRLIINARNFNRFSSLCFFHLFLASPSSPTTNSGRTADDGHCRAAAGRMRITWCCVTIVCEKQTQEKSELQKLEKEKKKFSHERVKLFDD